MPEGFQTRLLVVAAAVLAALYMLSPTILTVTCARWEFGCVEGLSMEEESTKSAANPEATPSTSDASLRNPDAEVKDAPDLNANNPKATEIPPTEGETVAMTPADAGGETMDATEEPTATEMADATDTPEEMSDTPEDEATPEPTDVASGDDDDNDDNDDAAVAEEDEEEEDTRPFLAKFLPERKLRLGLDLVGGIHLVLDVKTKDTLRLTAENYRRDLNDRLTEEGFSIDSVTRPQDSTTLEVTIANPADREKIETFVREEITRELLVEGFEETPEGKGIIRYAFDQDRADQISEDAVAQVLEILRSRVDEFGVAEPLIYRERGTRIVVQLPGLTDPEAAIRTIKRTARLEFRIVDEEWYGQQGNAAIPYLQKITADAVSALGEDATDEQINRYAWQNNLIPPNSQIFYEKSFDPLEKQTVRQLPWLVSAEIGLLGDRLETARVQQDRFGKPAVGFEMTPEGSVAFGRLTEENRGKRLAIILEGQLRSAPEIRDKITRSGQITLGSHADPATQYKEANEIAQVLRSGALPATVSIEQNWTVGSTLGEDAIQQGTRALMIGGLLVLIFMVFWYKVAGLWADLAVLLSGILLFALMTLFGFTLTLPGIAGIVLTVGMAVDANVLIYERIREELRAGKVPRAAVDAGFNKAFSTIVDANLTTAAAAFVLYYFGTGPIQGFALTLMCGIATTLFGGLVITRLFLEWRAYGRRVEKLSI